MLRASLLAPRRNAVRVPPWPPWNPNFPAGTTDSMQTRQNDPAYFRPLSAIDEELDL
jgi:hypothetical protein